MKDHATRDRRVGASPPAAPQARTHRNHWLNGLAAAAMWLAGPAAAQESGHPWTHVELATTHATQQQALAAARAQSGGYQYISAIKKRAISETQVELTYGIPTELSQLNEWRYTVVGLDVTGPEQAFIDALKAKYDQQSTDRGCAANTTVVRNIDWGTLNQWSDGTAQRQQTGYNIKWNRKSSGVCSLYDDVEFAIRQRTRCSNQYVAWNASDNTCSDDFYIARLTAPPLYCDGCTLVGDPVDFSTGDQYETENDVDLSWIRFDRYYHSVASNAAAGFGHGWTHSHDIRLAIQGSTDPTLGLIQANGSHLPFRNLGTYYEAVDGSGDRITASGANWVLQRDGGSLSFNAAGQLLEQRPDNGTALSYAYDALGRLTTITHSTGRSLIIAYTGVAANAPIASLASGGKVLAAYTYTANGQVATVNYQTGISTRRYHYEDANVPYNLTGISVEAPLGGSRYKTFAYDTQGRSISAQLAGGVDGVTVAYSAQGGAVVTDALGDTTDYGLTTAGAASKPRKAGNLSDSQGTVGRTYYDDASDFRRRIDTVTDRKGTQTKHSYTEANDPVTGQPAWTHAVTEAYQTPYARTSGERRDSASNRLVLSKVGHRETRITRNARLQPASVTVRDTITNQTRTTTYSYCEAADVAASDSPCPILGLLKSVDGPRTDVNDVTTFAYYGSDDSTCAGTPALCTYRKGDLRKVIDALGRATEVAGYDPQGRPLSMVDANGVATDYVYNPRGWLTTIKVRGPDHGTESDDRITQIAYRPNGTVQTITSPDGSSVGFSYDNAQRLIGMLNGHGDAMKYTLDSAGNVKKQENEFGSGQLAYTFSRIYNALGQLTAAKDASQNATLFDYDSEGNLQLTTDALGRKTRQSYDPLNRLIATLQDADGLQVETRVEYNVLNQVTKVTDPKGLETLYSYNGLGEQTRLTSPDTGVTDYTYDAAGSLATKKDANDAVAHRYAYDALNRPTAIYYTASGPADVEYEYDTVNPVCATDETFALGRVTAMRAEGTELKYCYDRFGQRVRKVQTVGGQSFTLRYAYTQAGRLQTVTYPDGARVEYARNTDGRIAGVQVTPAGGVHSQLLDYVLYQPFGPPMAWGYGNGRTVTIDADLDYRTTSIRDPASGGLSLGYVYNEVGEIKELKDGLLSASLTKYDHDPLGRLTVTRDGPTATALETYGYDATGNRTSLLRAGVTDTYTYPGGSHRLTSIGATARSYDAVGNTLAIGGTAREYVYNANDRMKQVKQGGVVTMGYRYNALGERVAAITGDTGPVTTYTLYDEAGHWIGDYDSTGAAIHQAIWMDDTPVGLLAGAGTAQSLKYVQPDHLGTPRAVIDPTRNVAIWTWDAKGEAFGNSPPNQDPDLDGTAFVFNMRFPGQRHDPSTGLSYNYYRDYDPSVGRYIQSDPIGLNGGISSYGYVAGQPLTLSDRFGLELPFSGNNGGRKVGWETPDAGSGYAVGAMAAGVGIAIGGALGIRVLLASLPHASSINAAGVAVAEGIAGVPLGAAATTAIGAACKITDGLATGSRVFTSADPLVGALATKIEAAYPGHVVGVNVPIRDAAGRLITDADILLQNAIIQVKSGGGKGLTSQIQRTENATGLPTVGYGPDLKPSILRSCVATSCERSLIEVVKP